MRFLLEPNGPLAQVVEQLAFNQRVAGSSPARLTLDRITYGYRIGSFFFRLQVHLQVLVNTTDQAEKQEKSLYAVLNESLRSGMPISWFDL